MIDKISSSILPIKPAAVTTKNETGAAGLGQSFGDMLNNAINQINTETDQVNKLNNQFITGGTTDVHQLMINSEKLSLDLELTVQIRNKVLDAYQEVMRMQV